MPETIRKLHAMGFKVRLYTEVGPGLTCCGKTKSSGTNGLLDAQSFAAWKVDGVTVDTCSDQNPDSVKRAEHEQFLGYLASTGIPINYDLHVSPTHGQYSEGAADWMGQVDSWQFTTEWGTISDPWDDAVSHIDMAASTVQWMRPGHTPNLLIISGDLTAYGGNFGKLLFTFWSMFQSPLVVAEDYISYPGWDGARFQTNRYCIAIDQDALFAQPVKAITNGMNSEVWVKPLSSGGTALAFLNRGTVKETIDVDFRLFGIPDGQTFMLTDAWAGTNLTTQADKRAFSSPAQSAQLWLMNPPSPQSLRATRHEGGIELSWPAAVAMCHVEASPDLSSMVWERINEVPSQRRDLMRVRPQAMFRTMFYRLVYNN